LAIAPTRHGVQQLQALPYPRLNKIHRSMMEEARGLLDLPDELIHVVMGYLDPFALTRFRAVSRQFLAAADTTKVLEGALSGTYVSLVRCHFISLGMMEERLCSSQHAS
jgi:hypothetical protein